MVNQKAGVIVNGDELCAKGWKIRIIGLLAVKKHKAWW